MKSRKLSIFIVWSVWIVPTLVADQPDQKKPSANAKQAEQRDWPYYPINDVPVPKVAATDIVRNEVDAFIQQRLEVDQLQIAPEAQKRTLIRRLYFDLIGLPPTPDQVSEFVNSQDPKAYEKLVDKLLDDPRYGERYARYWLDLARYADTAGYEGDPDLPHAWRYRDYVIDAFNNDKPYDLFIKEQIAGDEFQEIMGAGDLPKTPAERMVAMTFLRLAPFTEPRGDETRHEFLSEITSTVGSVFLGLTVGCAKCHDHKYDDIPIEDFYRMKAFFATVSMPRPEPGDAYQIGGPIPANFYRKGEKQWVENKKQQLIAERDSAKAELAKLTRQIEKRIGSSKSGFGIQLLADGRNDYVFQRQSVNDGQIHFSIISSDSDRYQLATDSSKPGNTGTLSGGNKGAWFAHVPSIKQVSIGQHTAGSGKPAESGHTGQVAEVLIYDHPLNRQELESVSQYIQAKYQSESSTASDDALPKQGLKFWLDASDLDADPNTSNPSVDTKIAAWKDKVAGIELLQAHADLQPKMSSIGNAKVAALQFNKSFLAAQTKTASFAKDRQGSIVMVYSATHSDEGYGFEVGGDGAFLSTVIHPAADKTSTLDLIRRSDSKVTREERQRYEYLSTRDRYVGQHLKRLNPVAMTVRHSYGPPFEPGVPVSRVMNRGEYSNPGDVVEPGFLSCITGHQKPASIRLDPFKRWPTRSRRMALAQWIASSKNPLTARVMVNRIWQWHFGVGLVDTPSDFGNLSSGASHPKLLDWLAHQFISNKWSVKTIHRKILNSATYCQSSTVQNEAAKKADVENRLLWKFNRRRLDAEAIRDSVLAVSGRLNSEMYGLPIFPPLPEDLAERVKYSESKWDSQYGPEGRRRSLYIYQQRTLTMPLMQTFDSLVCEESRPKRRTSTTPLQALAMYNGQFVNDEAVHFAKRLTEKSSKPDEQVAIAFKLALGREPTDTESDKMTKFLQSGPDGKKRLEGLCRILFNSNEFVYVD